MLEQLLWSIPILLFGIAIELSIELGLNMANVFRGGVGKKCTDCTYFKLYRYRPEDLTMASCTCPKAKWSWADIERRGYLMAIIFRQCGWFGRHFTPKEHGVTPSDE